MSYSEDGNVGTHTNADKSVVFAGYACPALKQPLTKWGYNPRPLGDHDVEIHISHCGICGSDLHQIDGGWGGKLFPMVPGHEIVGKVTNMGPSVSNVKVGDRVGVGAQVLSCLDKENCVDCKNGDEQHCTRGAVYTYNSEYSDKQRAYGGYVDRVRAHEHFVFKIPESIPTVNAGPLLCAGATVYAPLARYKVGKGKKVAVVGIGGLGHLGVQFASKMGAHVTAISSSDSKRQDALKLGAVEYLNSSNADELKAARRRFDVVLMCANHGVSDENLATYLSLVATNGNFVLVALPEHNLSVGPFSLMNGGISISGSSIASRRDLLDMLEFASNHSVHPWVEVMPIDAVNEAIAKVRENKCRFRVVLEHHKE